MLRHDWVEPFFHLLEGGFLFKRQVVSNARFGRFFIIHIFVRTGVSFISNSSFSGYQTQDLDTWVVCKWLMDDTRSGTHNDYVLDSRPLCFCSIHFGDWVRSRFTSVTSGGRTVRPNGDTSPSSSRPCSFIDFDGQVSHKEEPEGVGLVRRPSGDNSTYT